MYGREESEWEELVTTTREILEEVARRRAMTDYSSLNTELATRTGLRSFDFASEADRAAMGRLLGRVVQETLPETGLMLSALVHYLGGNDAGAGFYGLAVQLGLLPAKPSREAKERFWVSQVSEVHEHYA